MVLTIEKLRRVLKDAPDNYDNRQSVVKISINGQIYTVDDLDISGDLYLICKTMSVPKVTYNALDPSFTVEAIRDIEFTFYSPSPREGISTYTAVADSSGVFEFRRVPTPNG